MTKSSRCEAELKWTPFFVLLSREIQRFLKVIVQTIVSPLINSSLYLLIFGVSLGKSIEVLGGMSYLAFLIPGLVMMSCLNNSFQNTSSSV
ncbi:MAG: ABC transporter permease, partial [Bdellovibrionales bacterium]|nr:ABC transporter permease [Bdellovibrionales bacterium]